MESASNLLVAALLFMGTPMIVAIIHNVLVYMKDRD